MRAAAATMPRMSWWRTSRGRTQALLLGFAVVALFGMLVTAVFNYLLAGDERVVVVTMQQGVTDQDRTTLKEQCGILPGVAVVPDRGAREAQYRFPVRFDISGTTTQQEAALQDCIGRYPQLVRGLITEGDAA